jgi:hypothetical protein
MSTMTRGRPGWRLHGLVMTTPCLDDLADRMAAGGYDAKKVVNAGWGVPQGGWSHANMQRVLHEIPGVTILRTNTGDQGFRWNFPFPDQVAAEIRPWYERHRGIWVEIGNEPNTAEWRDASPRDRHDWLWGWRGWFDQTIRRCRNEFPEATFVSPGLGPIEQETWHGACAEAFRQADVIGVRAFAPSAYVAGTDAHPMDRTLGVFGRHYPDKRWLVTEYRPDRPPAAGQALTAGPPLPMNVEGVVSFSLPGG